MAAAHLVVAIATRGPRAGRGCGGDIPDVNVALSDQCVLDHEHRRAARIGKLFMQRTEDGFRISRAQCLGKPPR